MLRRDGRTFADSDALITIFEKILKDHEMLFKKNMKNSISEAEARPQFLYGMCFVRDGRTFADSQIIKFVIKHCGWKNKIVA